LILGRTAGVSTMKEKTSQCILLVTPWNPCTIGGVSAVIESLSHEFRRMAHQVTILVANGENRLSPVTSPSDVPTFSIYLRTPRLLEAPIRSTLTFFLFLPSTLWQLWRLLRRRRIELVLIQYPMPNASYFAVLRRLVKFRLVVTYQGSDAHGLMSWSRTDRQLIRFLLKTADCVTAVSHTLIDEVRAALPSLRMKSFQWLPNGAPLEMIAKSPDHDEGDLPPNYLLTAGHLIHRKGIDLIIEALSLLAKDGVRLNLIVAGDGPDRQKLADLAAKKGLAHHVHFIGAQPRERVFALMKRCAVFVLASRAEGLPLVLAEAMACGAPIVATSVDGVPEIVQHGRTGLLATAENPTSLATMLRTLLSDPALRTRLADQGQAWATTRHDWAVLAREYLALGS
jgi:glycosyltransferase involved in cell wall biosynthesis